MRDQHAYHVRDRAVTRITETRSHNRRDPHGDPTDVLAVSGHSMRSEPALADRLCRFGNRGSNAAPTRREKSATLTDGLTRALLQGSAILHAERAYRPRRSAVYVIRSVPAAVAWSVVIHASRAVIPVSHRCVRLVLSQISSSSRFAHDFAAAGRDDGAGECDDEREARWLEMPGSRARFDAARGSVSESTAGGRAFVAVTAAVDELSEQAVALLTARSGADDRQRRAVRCW